MGMCGDGSRKRIPTKDRGEAEDRLQAQRDRGFVQGGGGR